MKQIIVIATLGIPIVNAFTTWKSNIGYPPNVAPVPTSTSLKTEKDDVTDFASYMASRKDNILGSSNDKKMPPDEDSEKNKKKGWRIANFLYGNSQNGNRKLVQPISLDGSILNTSTSNASSMSNSSNTMSSSSTSSTTSSTSKTSYTSLPNPPSLLQRDMDNINANYDNLRASIHEQFEQLREKDPDSIPENTDDILNFVLEQQKEYEIMEKSQQRAQESFDEYEQRKRKEFEKKTLTAARAEDGGAAVDEMMKEIENDPLVQEIMKEAEQSYAYTTKQNEELRKFKDYEAAMKSSVSKSGKDIVVDMSTLDSPKSFDELQLKLLEDLLEKRKASAEADGFEDEDIYLTDNIEDGIEELQKNIESNKASSYKPQTMKEWQMYRAIATKMANSRKGVESDNEMLEEDAEIIKNKVSAWKEFVRLEQEMRRKSGLTIEYRPPFEWSDKKEQTAPSPQPRGPIDMEKAEQAKTELDNLALKVLTDLMERTKDPSRQEKLKQEIQELKDGIVARQEYLKRRPTTPPPKQKPKPLMINDILRPSTRKSIVQTQVSPAIEETDDDDDDDLDEDEFEEDFDYDIEESDQPPPDSIFFRELQKEDHLYDYVDEEREDDGEMMLKSDVDDDNDDDVDIDEELSLGTLEQQKFRSLVARSGVRTVEGQNELRKKWEDFQEAEKKMRELSGLSSSSAGSLGTKPKVNYDPSELFKADGDIDFDKILSSIGTRPSRKNVENTKFETNSAPVVAPVAPDANVILEPTPIVETIKETESLKRDNISKQQKSSDYENNKEDSKTDNLPGLFGFDGSGEVETKFLKGQYAGFERRKQDLLEYPILSVAQINSLVALKNSPFETGVSPYLARMNKPYKDYGAIFHLEGVLVDITGMQYEAWKRVATEYKFPPPVMEDMKFAAVHSDEYCVQKVFYWTDDFLIIKQVAKTFKEFQREVFENWKDSKKILSNEIDDIPSDSQDDSPEGFISQEDIIKIQFRAWERAANSYGFEPPTLDLLSVAEGMEPTNAIRSIFRWSKDFVICNDVANAYRKYLKRETDKWLAESGGSSQIPARAIKVNDKVSSEHRHRQSSGPSFEEILKMKQTAWENAILEGNTDLPVPTLDDLRIAEYAGPERAMTSIFKWNASQENLDHVMKQYKAHLRSLTEKLMTELDAPMLSDYQKTDEDDSSENILAFELKQGVIKWLTSLRDVFVPVSVITQLDKDLADNILETTGISEYFPVDHRVYGDSSYDSEVQQMLGAALRLDRRPDHCITFSATPQSAVAAHEVEMKNIAIVSPYPYYELTNADSTVRNFDSLGIVNIKNVFSEMNIEPLQQLQVEEPLTKRKTMLKTRFWDDDEN
jgi:beta-phosphoglucomutase-like phosphatase (HAD superfamily)